jgi:hypothetical protein
MAERTITLPLDDYKRLLESAWCDDMMIKCEVCGAWLDRDDPATAKLEDFEGCWKMAARDGKHDHLCRSYRAPE